MNVIIQTIETLGLTRMPTAKDFNKANFRGFVIKWIGVLNGHSTHLRDMDTISRWRNIRNRRFRGTFTIQINQIKGSEGRCQDFNPLKLRNRERWLSIARAWYRGISLPAVELIKIGDTYIVRDGHHRISVAQYMVLNLSMPV